MLSRDGSVLFRDGSFYIYIDGLVLSWNWSVLSRVGSVFSWNGSV